MPHGHLLAGEVGDLVGVSGTTVGQWARRGLIRSSQSSGDPRVYAVEDVAEAAVVAELLARGVHHRQLHRLRALLGGRYPFVAARLATAPGRGRSRVLVRERAGLFELTARGWQASAEVGDADEVHLRLHPPAD